MHEYLRKYSRQESFCAKNWRCGTGASRSLRKSWGVLLALSVVSFPESDAVTPETAKGLLKLLGHHRTTGWSLESQYVSLKVKTEDGIVARKAALYGRFPVREMIRRAGSGQRERRSLGGSFL